MARFTLKLLLFCLLAVVLQVVISLDWSWGGDRLALGPNGEAVGKSAVSGTDSSAASAGAAFPLRVGLPPVDRYEPDSAILLFQGYMKPHPRLGFTFKANLGEGEPVLLQWADQEPGAIHSDSAGFINSPYAIAALKEGRKVDVIGVGSSFMQGAADKFHDFFWAKGLFFYSMATPRHTLQQFTAVVKEYAAPLKPGWIVYDLNEASFELLTDFDAWAGTGADWFDYHSGTWCGPPRKASDRMLADFPVLEALYAGVRRRIHPETPVPLATDAELSDRALREILAARDAAEAAGSRFTVMTIPSRDVIVYGKSARWHRVQQLLPRLEAAGVEILDLKPIFAAEDDPRSLYFKVDAHWNGYGIYKAAAAMAMRLAAGPPGTGTRRADVDVSNPEANSVGEAGGL